MKVLKLLQPNCWAEFITSLDSFPKIERSYIQTSVSSGGVSLFVFAIISFLVISEFVHYSDTEFVYSLQVDSSYDELIRMNVDITVAMPCYLIGADVVDVTGKVKAGEDHLTYADTTFKLSGERKVAYESAKMLNEYLRIEYHSLHETLWGMPPGLMASATERQREPGTDACWIHGYYLVRKVAGNFHILLGKPLPIAIGGHMHVGAFGGSMNSLNYSHRIDHLSFGDDISGRLNPLDSELCVASDSQHLFQYFLQIVPTTVRTVQYPELSTFQFSVTTRSRPVTAGAEVAGIFFKFDFTSFQVSVDQTQHSFLHFLIRQCALIGGVFVTVGACRTAFDILFGERKLRMSALPSVSVSKCYTC